MKIEKISETSIRCTLTSFDLSVRNMNLRELAYGSEKARRLFKEMMNQASTEVGFNVDNTPLMIEAIPLSNDSIQLVITKVEDPEELDTRFSRFSQSPGFNKAAEGWLQKLTNDLLEGAAGSILDKLHKIGPAQGGDQKEGMGPGHDHMKDQIPQDQPAVPNSDPGFRAFEFNDLDMVCNAAKASAFYQGGSVLYKKLDGRTSYVLVILDIHRGKEAPTDDFSRASNTISEYGRMMRITPNSLSYYDEHYETVIPDQAIGKLSRI